MNETLLAAIIGGIVGVVLLILAVILFDLTRTWARNYRRLQELRQRPRVPYKVKSYRAEYDGDEWGFQALDRDNKVLGQGWDRHPVDALIRAMNGAERN